MSLSRVLAVLCFLVVAPLAYAQGVPERYQAGVHYFPIVPAQPTSSGDRIEVIEVFSYGCIHCFNFEPEVEKWMAAKPANTTFDYLPATFRPDFALLARGYYAAEALGVRHKTHQALFDAIFKERRLLRTIEDLADFYAQAGGVDRAKFLDAAKSFEVETKLTRATNLLQAYQVDGTPTIIVAGKYRVTGQSAGDYSRVFDVVNYLVAKEAAARKS
jgi:thiol:disulfide interchange protein DsbA